MNAKGFTFAVIGLIVGVLLYAVALRVYPPVPLHCADGWASPSIGLMGACSHHGGVVGGDTMPTLVRVACIFSGLLTFVGLSSAFGGFNHSATNQHRPISIEEKRKFILKAITQGHALQFLYQKSGATESTMRTIQPSSLKRLSPGRSRTLCVVGYCYLRNAERTFLLARMSDVELAVEADV